MLGILADEQGLEMDRQQPVQRFRIWVVKEQ